MLLEIQGKYLTLASTKKDVFLTAVARSGATVVAGLSAVVIAQDIGASALGLFGLIRAVPAVLLLITELGIASATPYLINRRRYAAQDVFSMTLAAALVVGLFDVLLWTAGSSLLASHLLRGLPFQWVILTGLVIPALAIESAMSQVLRAKQLFKQANALRWGLEASIFVIIALLATLDKLEAWMLVPSLLGAHLVIIVFGWLRLSLHDLIPRPRISLSLLREAVRFGIRSQIGNTLNMLNYRMDHLILGVLTDLRTVGIYVVASKAAEFFRIVTVALTFVLEPQLANTTLASALKRTKRLLGPAFVTNLTVVAVAWFIGPLVIPVLFDQWSLSATLPFQILLIGLAARGTNGVLVALNSGQGRPELTTYCVAVGFVLTVVLDIVLIPRWHVIGAAIASSVAQASIAIGLLLSLSFMHRQLKSDQNRTI